MNQDFQRHTVENATGNHSVKDPIGYPKISEFPSRLWWRQQKKYEETNERTKITKKVRTGIWNVRTLLHKMGKLENRKTEMAITRQTQLGLVK